MCMSPCIIPSPCSTSLFSAFDQRAAQLLMSIHALSKLQQQIDLKVIHYRRELGFQMI